MAGELDMRGPRDADPTFAALRYRTIHGHRRAFRMEGSGPPLLLLHGIADHSESWLPVFAQLARSYTVIAPDLLGHGASDKPLGDYSVAAYANGARDLLDVLGFDRATVIGHSLGGGIAAQFAYQYPDRCERLVLVASGGVGREVAAVLRLAAAPMSEVLLPMVPWPVVRPLAGVGVQALRLIDRNLGRDLAEFDRILDGFTSPRSRMTFTYTLRSAVNWRGQVVTMLDRCYLTEDMPVLLVWGSNDGIIPVAHAFKAHAAMPGSKLVIFDGAGHFPHHHDPDRFVDAVQEFIATTPSAAYRQDTWRARLRQGKPALDFRPNGESSADPDAAGVASPGVVAGGALG